MNFLINVIRIFFRNKGSEIKSFFYNRSWYNIVEAMIVVGVAVIAMFLLFGIGYGTGYLLMDILEWVNVTWDIEESKIRLYVGFVFWCALCLSYCAVVLIYSFFKWIWTNIKIAITEARG